MSSPRRHSDRFRQRSLLRGERGISLIEVMAAMVISLMVVGAGFTVLISTQKAARVNSLVAQTQQSSRIAMELIARDVKMAGFGMPAGGVGGCTAPIVPLDNNAAGVDAGPDSVSLVIPNTNAAIAPFWQLAGPANGPFNAITLQGGAVADMQAVGLAGGTAVSIGGAVSATVQAINPATDTITLTNFVGAPKVFPISTQVYMLECVTYAIGTTAVACAGNAPCLLRAGVPLVEGIEDLQLAYACDGCNALVNGGVPDGIPDDQDLVAGFTAGDFITDNTWGLAPMTPDTIRLVQINLVARQSAQDEGLDEGKTRAESMDDFLQVSDHNHGADGVPLDTYKMERRRVLTRTVQMRNVGP